MAQLPVVTDQPEGSRASAGDRCCVAVGCFQSPDFHPGKKSLPVGTHRIGVAGITRGHVFEPGGVHPRKKCWCQGGLFGLLIGSIAVIRHRVSQCNLAIEGNNGEEGCGGGKIEDFFRFLGALFRQRDKRAEKLMLSNVIEVRRLG